MDRRSEVRKRDILKEAEVKPQVVEGILSRLEEFAEPFVASLGRSERREHSQVHIAGLLSDLERKNVESVAYRPNQERVNLQRFIGLLDMAKDPCILEKSSTFQYT